MSILFYPNPSLDWYIPEKLFMIYLPIPKNAAMDSIMLMKKILQGSFQTLLFSASLVLMYFFIKLICTLYYLPIYPDEIAIRLWLSRAVFDFPFHVNVMPSGANYLLPMPGIWYLPGFIEWLLHGMITSLQTLRIVGIVIYLFMIALLARILIQDVQKSFVFKTYVGFGSVIALFSLGVLPTFFVTNRPEQILLVCLIFLFMMERKVRTHPDQEASLPIILGFLVCVSLMLYVHPKAFYLAPLFFFIGLRFVLNSPKRILPYLVFAFLGILMVGNLFEWKSELHYDPIVKQYMDSFNINPGDFLTHRMKFLTELHSSIIDTGKLFTKLGYQVHTDIDYLPPLALTQHDIEMNTLLNLNCAALFFVLLGYLAYRFIMDCLRGKFLSPYLLFLSVMTVILSGSLLNLTKTWYDVGYFWAVMMVIGVFSLTDRMNAMCKSVLGSLFILYLMTTAVLSIIFFQLNYNDLLLQGYSGPSVSLVNFNYNDYKKEAKLVARSCLSNTKRNHGIVLDDFTYLYFKKFKDPMLITYVNNHTDSNKFPVLIKEHKLTAVIIRCAIASIIPNANPQSILHFKDMCCYPQNKISELVG